MNHLDIVAGSISTDPIATRLAVALRRDALEDVLDVRPCLIITTGHKRRSMPGTFLTARHTTADVQKALLLNILGSALGIREMAVSAVDDDITFFQMRDQLIDEGIDRGAGLDEKHDTTRTLERGDKLGNGPGGDDVCSLCGGGHEVICLFRGAVVDGDDIAVVVHVEDDVLAHDGQADEADISDCGHCGGGLEKGSEKGSEERSEVVQLTVQIETKPEDWGEKTVFIQGMGMTRDR